MAKVRGATATKDLRKKAGNGKFLTLTDGDEIEGCFAGVLKHGLEGDLAEPIGIEVVWKTRRDGSRYSVEYDPKKHDEDEVKVSFMWNFLVRGEAEDGSEDEMKIFQQGPQFFDQFIKHKGKKGYGFWFTISREGSGQFDTKYSLDREDAIDRDEIEDIINLELHDLEKESSDQEQQQQQREEEKPKEKRERRRRRRASDAARTKDSATSSGDASDSGADGSGNNGSRVNGNTLDADQRSLLKELITGLPDPGAAKKSLMMRFGLDKLGALSADQFDDAKTFLEDISKGEGAPDAPVDDPFFG